MSVVYARVYLKRPVGTRSEALLQILVGRSGALSLHTYYLEFLGEEIPNRKSGMDGVSQIVYSSRKQAVRETQIASKTKASGIGRVCRMDSHI